MYQEAAKAAVTHAMSVEHKSIFVQSIAYDKL